MPGGRTAHLAVRRPPQPMNTMTDYQRRLLRIFLAPNALSSDHIPVWTCWEKMRNLNLPSSGWRLCGSDQCRVSGLPACQSHRSQPRSPPARHNSSRGLRPVSPRDESGGKANVPAKVDRLPAAIKSLQRARHMQKAFAYQIIYQHGRGQLDLGKIGYIIIRICVYQNRSGTGVLECIQAEVHPPPLRTPGGEDGMGPT